MDRKLLLQELVENLQNMYRGMLHRSDYQKHGLPFGQKAALFTIALHATTNIKQLAATLHITSGATTQHVEALVKAGLVERTADPDDRRNVVIVVSPQGKALLKQLKEARTLMVEELFGDVSDVDLQIYNNVMEQVNNKMKQREKTENV